MARSKLRIGIALSGEQASFWRIPLAQALREEGHDIAFVRGPVDEEVPGVALLTRLERLLGRVDPVAASEPPLIAEAQDLDLVIGSGGGRWKATPVLNLTCDGAPCAIGAVGAIVHSAAPQLQAAFTRPGHGGSVILASGRVALETANIFSEAHERIAGRLARIAVQAVRAIARDEVHAAPPASSPRGAATNGSTNPLRFALRIMAEAVARRLTRLARGGDRWRVAWRVTAGDEVAERMAWPAFGFQSLPDDGRRFYSDPFVFAHEGRTFVFCEEVPYATGRGLLSVFELAKGHVVSAPRPFLELPHHLSYPMIFARDGAVWMIPESRAINRIELWRAEKFPYEWRPSGILVDGVAASDATLLEQDGRLWLFATVAGSGGSVWDTLHLWSAEHLAGPWLPHPGNPVLIDASCARSGGMPLMRGGLWIRPAQDCSRMYGGGLTLCAIDRLDLTHFSQSVLARLGPPAGSGARGVHTLNYGGAIEAIDLFGPPAGDETVSSLAQADRRHATSPAAAPRPRWRGDAHDGDEVPAR